MHWVLADSMGRKKTKMVDKCLPQNGTFHRRPFVPRDKGHMVDKPSPQDGTLYRRPRVLRHKGKTVDKSYSTEPSLGTKNRKLGAYKAVLVAYVNCWHYLGSSGPEVSASLLPFGDCSSAHLGGQCYCLLPLPATAGLSRLSVLLSPRCWCIAWGGGSYLSKHWKWYPPSSNSSGSGPRLWMGIAKFTLKQFRTAKCSFLET